MNWGNKILIVYLVFVAGIVFMVVKSSMLKTDLVTTDYYAKELKYQDKIDEMGRVSALSAPVRHEIKEGVLVIEFPGDFSGKELTGEAVLYCPADKSKDITVPFALTDTVLKIALPSYYTGLYRLQLSWKDGNTTYYFENKIFI